MQGRIPDVEEWGPSGKKNPDTPEDGLAYERSGAAVPCNVLSCLAKDVATPSLWFCNQADRVGASNLTDLSSLWAF